MESKEKIIRLLYVISGFLVIAFFGSLISDYQTYPTGSAPFYFHILERGAEFLLPGAALMIVAAIAKRKDKK
jgi:hypothetical protein